MEELFDVEAPDVREAGQNMKGSFEPTYIQIAGGRGMNQFFGEIFPKARGKLKIAGKEWKFLFINSQGRSVITVVPTNVNFRIEEGYITMGVPDSGDMVEATVHCETTAGSIIISGRFMLSSIYIEQLANELEASY